MNDQKPTDAAPAAQKTYRIDDLARAAGTTVRNVRAYQERGVLPAPQRQGRAAIYTSEHLARLRLIQSLLERGFTLNVIAELLDAWQRGEALADVLGLEEALTSPFTDEQPYTITPEELLEIFGIESGIYLERAVEIGMFLWADGQLTVPNPTLLNAGAALVRMGVPVPALLDEMEALREKTDAIASGFVQLAIDHIFEGYVAGRSAQPAGDLAKDAWRLREIAVKVTQVELGRALQREIYEQIGVLLDKVAQKHTS